MNDTVQTPPSESKALKRYSLSVALAWLVLFLGLRVFDSSSTIRLGSLLLSFLLLLYAPLFRWRASKMLSGALKQTERLIILFYIVSIIAFVIFLLSTNLTIAWLPTLTSSHTHSAQNDNPLHYLWLALLSFSLFPLLFIELSYAKLEIIEDLDFHRITRASRAGLSLAMTLSSIVCINLIATQLNAKVDLSYFKTTEPSSSSISMVNTLKKPLVVNLFFSPENDVLTHVEAYFKDLANHSSSIQIKRRDHLLEPNLSKKYTVTRNGSVVLVQGKKHHQLVIGERLRRAKSKLKRLDGDFQKALRSLLSPAKTVYLTSGHQELNNLARDSNKGESITDLRLVLNKLNFRFKTLNMSNGLASDIPKDAALVIIAGPRKSFLAAEIDALSAYLKKGGKLLAFLDPEASLDFSALLNPLGLKMHSRLVANEKAYYRLNHSPADRIILLSNRYSAHPSVKTLAKLSHRVATLFIGSGSLEKTTTSKPTHKITFTIHSMPGSFEDLNGNFSFDRSIEKKKSFELAAAVSKQMPSDEMRAVIVADAGIASDRAFRNYGNQIFIADSIKWLTKNEAAIGKENNEEDIRILHTKKEDQFWFYLTILFAPFVVLIGGLLYTRRRKQKRKPS